MGESPSLLSLCMEAVTKEILSGDDAFPEIYDLPSELFDCLLMHSPPLALQKLQEQLRFEDLSDHEYTDDYSSVGRKRRRHDNFNTAWKALFNSRWPDLVGQIRPVDWFTKHRVWFTKHRVPKYDLTSEWLKIYWETHLQNCLDEAVEVALLPSFDGHISEIRIPDTIIKSIGCEGHTSHSTCNFSKLSHHCERFGYYARFLQYVLFLRQMSETSKCSLQFRNFSFIKELQVAKPGSAEDQIQTAWPYNCHSDVWVDGLCKLLSQNSETLMTLEFIDCKLSSTFLNAICGSLCMKGVQTPKVQHFSIKSSSFLETNMVSLPIGLESLLSGRFLSSLSFSDSQLGRNFATMVFNILLDASSSLSILDLSENNISGWLSNFNLRPPDCSLSHIGLGKSLQSLRVLNLRGNNLHKYDVGSLKHALALMPNLETLDISGNPIEDDGIKNLFPYIIEASEGNSRLSNLRLENCELSCNGVTQLLEILSTFKKPLYSLSIADNDLGSQIAAPLGKFGNFIKVLDVKDIGLGSSGFLDLQKAITEDVKLVYINLSNNRGGIETANFLSKLLSFAPDLVAVSAGYNIMPAECLGIIYSAMELAKGKLEYVDLRGNFFCYQPAHASMLAKVQQNGMPVVLLPSFPSSAEPYDDDP
ncbi:uncharacterized protein LOC131156192 isoform X2 [Malania oleifera]|nr:uncharacterized protein LOC131156192 isoform X2 [Malania oleifera]XP_057965671.1 uncharacterized protein LOC131156192 isoform X2 [Malania oleifera]XP_057965672.1 uncharacterized protein LOC131156192 isoform X2 [Malania oleifera]